MGYIPTEWETGDVITAEKLNKAEEGIAAASDEVFIVKITWGESGDTATLDKTLAEIVGSQVPVMIAPNEGTQVYYAGTHYTDPSEDPDGVYLYMVSYPSGSAVIVTFLFMDVDGTLTLSNAPY